MSGTVKLAELSFGLHAKMSTICRFGGKAGADILREHAIETRDILETSFTEANRDSSKSANNANRLMNNDSDIAAANISDTMEQLNQVGIDGELGMIWQVFQGRVA